MVVLQNMESEKPYDFVFINLNKKDGEWSLIDCLYVHFSETLLSAAMEF